MPYIAQHRQAQLDMGLASPETAGELTYCLTRELIDFLGDRLKANGQIRYQDIAECLGALEGASIDLTLRLLEPLEDGARVRNGDVWPDAILKAVKP
jgi:hypothetical protein